MTDKSATYQSMATARFRAIDNARACVGPMREHHDHITDEIGRYMQAILRDMTAEERLRNHLWLQAQTLEWDARRRAG